MKFTGKDGLQYSCKFRWHEGCGHKDHVNKYAPNPLRRCQKKHCPLLKESEPVKTNQ